MKLLDQRVRGKGDREKGKGTDLFLPQAPVHRRVLDRPGERKIDLSAFSSVGCKAVSECARTLDERSIGVLLEADEKLGEALAQAWINLQYAHIRHEKIDGLISAHDLLDKICERDPDGCLAIVVRILQLDSSEFIAANVGAGPLEDLLVRHGKAVMDRVEQLATTNHSFAVALSGVWRSTIDDEVWSRIATLRSSKH